MDQFIKTDSLRFNNDSMYKDCMENHDEVLWSGTLLKINYIHTRQKRHFVVATSKIFHYLPDKFSLKNLFRKRMRRLINLINIKAIVYSLKSNQFILKIPSSYDYFLESKERDQVIQSILVGLSTNGIQEIDFFFIDEVGLQNFVKFNNIEPKLKLPDKKE